jgi:hypothetical protein
MDGGRKEYINEENRSKCPAMFQVRYDLGTC